MSRDIVVIGASAGGLEPLRQLVGGLPSHLSAAMFVVVHGSRDSPGFLPDVLARVGPLPAAYADDGEAFQPGRIYVAPADRHMLLEDRRIVLSSGPRENGFRPAVDPLFRTAARSGRRRVIGVVLSGGLDDGTYGLAMIKREGGVALVQDVEEAAVPMMPASAIRSVAVDQVLRAAEMGPAIARLVIEPVRKGRSTMTADRHRSADPAEGGLHKLEDAPSGPPSPFRCPDCGGGLWETAAAPRQTRFTCHVGHAYTESGLIAGQEEMESALWVAVRALEEHAALHRRMAGRARDGKLTHLAGSFAAHAGASEQRARMLRGVLLRQVEAGSPALPGGARGANPVRRQPPARVGARALRKSRAGRKSRA